MEYSFNMLVGIDIFKVIFFDEKNPSDELKIYILESNCGECSPESSLLASLSSRMGHNTEVTNDDIEKRIKNLGTALDEVRNIAWVNNKLPLSKKTGDLLAMFLRRFDINNKKTIPHYISTLLLQNPEFVAMMNKSGGVV